MQLALQMCRLLLPLPLNHFQVSLFTDLKSDFWLEIRKDCGEILSINNKLENFYSIVVFALKTKDDFSHEDVVHSRH